MEITPRLNDCVSHELGPCTNILHGILSPLAWPLPSAQEEEPLKPSSIVSSEWHHSAAPKGSRGVRSAVDMGGHFIRCPAAPGHNRSLFTHSSREKPQRRKGSSTSQARRVSSASGTGTGTEGAIFGILDHRTDRSQRWTCLDALPFCADYSSKNAAPCSFIGQWGLLSSSPQSVR